MGCLRGLHLAIIIVSHDNAAFLVDEFGRYARDYDIRPATSPSIASDIATEIEATGGQVAMYVADSSLFPSDVPSDEQHNVLAAFHAWRQVVPTAKRLVVAPWERFLEDANRLRAGLAKGKYDAYLLMPRGVRDEEFHTAVCELLSDWGSTVALPEVETVRLVSPQQDALTLAIRDFLDRMGMPHRAYSPDTRGRPRHRSTATTARRAGRSWTRRTTRCSYPRASARWPP